VEVLCSGFSFLRTTVVTISSVSVGKHADVDAHIVTKQHGTRVAQHFELLWPTRFALICTNVHS